jgi:hypothetical protein
LEIKGELLETQPLPQWVADPFQMLTNSQGAIFDYQLGLRTREEEPLHTLLIRQRFVPLKTEGRLGLERTYEMAGLTKESKPHWRLLGGNLAKQATAKIVGQKLVIQLDQQGTIEVSITPAATLEWQDGAVIATPTKWNDGGYLKMTAAYTSSLPADEYHAPRPPPFPVDAPPVVIAPGFAGTRMTLPSDIMPTALAWGKNGNLVVASLKGQIVAFDKETLSQPMPRGKVLADGLAAPYGIKAGGESKDEYIDVATKYGLLRIHSGLDLREWCMLFNTDKPPGLMRHHPTTHITTIASGWGYTSDYHDWAVGLPQDAAGHYYLALPCFQDNRPAVAGRLRGSILKLTPSKPTPLHPVWFDKEVLTHGHRFPMGMALNAKEELFVTDNQGNYNPFNELNYVRPGKHFGFVNKGAEKPAEVTSPAIDIPHPWTRSVNGICFLLTPKGLQKEGKPPIFGPLEGHLVGCEYDTRRLIRMSLQRVGDDYQGCSYPLTVPTTPEESPLGPICCEISPAGELVIGNLRDSGWGAGNNIGEVIRIAVDPSQFGHGLAEMRATPTGFALDFFQPVDEKLATDPANYSLSSYRRESTPAYGGNDIDRRTEKVAKAELSEDRKRVLLTVHDLRAGHNYELRLKSLATDGSPFHPAEAHYTLRMLIE